MNTIKESTSSTFYRNVCIVMIWLATIYSTVVQYVLFQIPYGMLMFGGIALLFYIFANSDKPYVFRDEMTTEDMRMIWFMVYIFIVGLLFAPSKSTHASQWMTCMEYLILQIMISSIIKKTGTDSIHFLLLIVAIMLSVTLLRNPVNYLDTGRYTIAANVNPNGLGLGLVAGIWAALYRQINKKRSLVLTSIIIALIGYCVLLTGSRKSLIGAGLAILLWLFFCFIPSLKEKDNVYGIASFLIMLILAIIITYGFLKIYANTTIASRMDRLFYEASEGKRSNLYREGYELIKMNPLFGIGFQGFMYYFGGYSHATLVEIPVSGGIVGAALYFSVYILSLKKILYVYRTTKEKADFYKEHNRIKMIFALWIIMAFYTICVIHPYQFDSSIYFGIIFGETAYIQGKLKTQLSKMETKKIRSKYIRYESNWC